MKCYSIISDIHKIDNNTKRIDELLPLTGDDKPRNDPNVIELDMLSDLVVEYEAIHYPLESPSFIDIIKLRMYEWGLTQKKVAEMLNISTSKMSEIMNGKNEPSLTLGRTMCQKLDISPEIMLGL
mgnify:CR=1 FL=1